MDTPAPDARQLVLCFDGTNNTLTAQTQDTNVLRLHRHLSLHPAPNRLLYYDPGVGSPDGMPPTGPGDWFRRTSERIQGLASGRGVYDNIAAGYLFLMRNWRSDADQIYCFGFSRGAFTARCVAGMVNLFGLLDLQYEVLLPTLVRIYFSQPPQHGKKARKRSLSAKLHRRMGLEKADRDTLAAQVRTQFTGGSLPWVHWVGVWDTVESVGLPGPLSQSNPSTATMVGKRMRHVRHALALDEHRYAFLPRLYEEPGDIDLPQPRQTLKQRWFSGVHCDVGGGYPVAEAGLSDQAMVWMVDEVASELGIPPWTPAPADAVKLQHDPLWDTAWWALAGMWVRDMQPRVSPSAGGQAIAVIPAAVSGPTEARVWQRKRPVWPLVFAVLGGLLCLILSGACLDESGLLSLWPPGGGGTLQALQAAIGLAQQQISGDTDLLHRHGVGWALFWDLGFIAAWGYLLARISSRGFAWLVGSRKPGQSMPAWRWMGMLPLFAFGADLLEDALTWLALVFHGLEATLLSQGLLGLVVIASVVKIVALLGNGWWLLLRIWIALPGVKRWRK